MPAKLLLVGCGLTSALTASLLSKTTSLELTIWEKARGVGQSANSGGFGFLRVQSFFLFFLARHGEVAPCVVVSRSHVSTQGQWLGGRTSPRTLKKRSRSLSS